MIAIIAAAAAVLGSLIQALLALGELREANSAAVQQDRERLSAQFVDDANFAEGTGFADADMFQKSNQIAVEASTSFKQRVVRAAWHLAGWVLVMGGAGGALVTAIAS